MKPMQTPTLMLKRTVNNWNEVANPRRDLMGHLALNHGLQTVATGTHKADPDPNFRLTFFAKAIGAGAPVTAGNGKDLTDRPPQRWGINE